VEQSGVRLVCFDWGGVILRICRSWAQGCERAGLPLRWGAEADEMKAARRKAGEDYQIGRIDCSTFCARVSAATGGLYSPEEVARVHDAWLIEEYPGVSGLVDRLHTVPRIQTALLSNTNHGHWVRHLSADGRGPDFPTVAKLHHRFGSHLLGLAKPGREIYQELERQTGHTGPSILFFDDLIENVQAARAAGWRAEQIDHTADTAAQIQGHLRRHGVL
jgi:FMN phosphatase YigB (HAD superfamily)